MNTPKIKILYGLPSFSLGGLENQLLQQFFYIDTSKYEIYLITLFHYESRPDLFDKIPPHIKIRTFDFHGYFDFKNLLALYRALKNIRPHIVVSSMFSGNAIFRVFKIFFGYKVITREHNTYTDRTIFHRIAENLLSHLSNEIVAVSKDVAEFYSRQNYVNRKKVTVINNGIDLEKIEQLKTNLQKSSALRSELNISITDKLIINVARLKKQKNHLLLIDVFNKFQKIKSDFKLIILGGGQEQENLSKKIDTLQLNDKIKLLGFRKDVHEFYSISDFFVLSSIIEGFPNVFLEAMAFGLPVISTSVPGANEIIVNGQNGYIVDNPDEMLEKMLLISSLDQEKINALKKECLNTVKKFDINIITKEYENMFTKALFSK